MSDQSVNQPVLEWTGERYVPEIEGSLRLEHLHRYFIAREVSEGKRVLDIACGEGYGSAILATVACRVYGVDIADNVVAHAASKYRHSSLEFMQGSCDAIPLPEDSVDVVVSFETIEHTDRHEDTMREIRRVLCPGGLLVISSPDRHEYSDVLGNRNEFHVRELDRLELERLLRSHFCHVSLAGQRVCSGSIVGPLDDSTVTRFLTFPSPDAEAKVAKGLKAPAYLLALASDQPLPPWPVGLVDGEPFIWSSELREHLAEAERQCTTEIARRLGDVVQLAGASADEIRAEFNRQVDRITELLTEVSSSHAVHKTHALEMESQLVRETARLEAQLARTAHLEAQLAESLQQRASLQAQRDIYEHSKSWRLTAPLRAAAKMMRRLTLHP